MKGSSLRPGSAVRSLERSRRPGSAVRSFKETSPRTGSATGRASATGKVTLGYGKWNRMQSAAQLMTVKYLDKIAHQKIHPEVSGFKREEI